MLFVKDANNSAFSSVILPTYRCISSTDFCSIKIGYRSSSKIRAKYIIEKVISQEWTTAVLESYIYIYIYIYTRRSIISDRFYGPPYVSHLPYCSGKLDVIHHCICWIFIYIHNVRTYSMVNDVKNTIPSMCLERLNRASIYMSMVGTTTISEELHCLADE